MKIQWNLIAGEGSCGSLLNSIAAIFSKNKFLTRASMYNPDLY